jgi:hypothetical protein
MWPPSSVKILVVQKLLFLICLIFCVVPSMCWCFLWRWAAVSVLPMCYYDCDVMQVMCTVILPSGKFTLL